MIKTIVNGTGTLEFRVKYYTKKTTLRRILATETSVVDTVYNSSLPEYLSANFSFNYIEIPKIEVTTGITDYIPEYNGENVAIAFVVIVIILGLLYGCLKYINKTRVDDHVNNLDVALAFREQLEAPKEVELKEMFIQKTPSKNEEDMDLILNQLNREDSSSSKSKKGRLSREDSKPKVDIIEEKPPVAPVIQSPALEKIKEVKEELMPSEDEDQKLKKQKSSRHHHHRSGKEGGDADESDKKKKRRRHHHRSSKEEGEQTDDKKKKKRRRKKKKSEYSDSEEDD